MIKFVDVKIGDDVTFYALIENMQKMGKWTAKINNLMIKILFL